MASYNMNKDLVKLVDDIDQKIPGVLDRLHQSIQKTIAKNFCTNCQNETDPAKYKNKIDADEYYISGLCDECQIEFFKEED